jgi:hypothetical protein
MNLLLNIFALIQALGAIIGAGGSVWGELSYLKAMQDGRVDSSERMHLRRIARALRWGMILLLIGSIGLVLSDYIFSIPLQPALSTSYWSEMTLALIVIASAWALSRRKLPFWLLSAAVFTGWWFLAALTLGQLPALSWGATLAAYVVATGIMAAILSYARMLTSRE